MQWTIYSLLSAISLLKITSLCLSCLFLQISIYIYNVSYLNQMANLLIQERMKLSGRQWKRNSRKITRSIMTAMTTTTMMIIKKRRMGTWCLSWIVRVTWRKDTDTKNIIRNATVIKICTKLSRSSSQSSDCSSLYLSSSQCSGMQFFFISITAGFCEITIKEIIVRIIQRIIIYIGYLFTFFLTVSVASDADAWDELRWPKTHRTHPETSLRFPKRKRGQWKVSWDLTSHQKFSSLPSLLTRN